MSHTPGKWEAVGEGMGSEIYGNVPFDSNCIEFTLKKGRQLLFYAPFVQFPSKEYQEMQTANARLIASAPELLEAGKEVLHIIEMCHIPGSSNPESATGKLRKAIAKAEGKNE